MSARTSPTPPEVQGLESRPGRRGWWVLSVLMAVAVGGSCLDYAGERERSRGRLGSELAAICDLKLAGIEWWRRERLADARHFRSLAPILSLFRPYLEAVEADPTKRTPEAALISAWMSSLCGGAGYTSVRLVDRQGRVPIAFPPHETAIDPVEAVWAEEAIRTQATQLRDLEWTSATNTPRVDLIVPVPPDGREEGGGRPGRGGALILRCEVQEFYPVLLSSWPLRTPGSTALVRSEGGRATVLSFDGTLPRLAPEPSWPPPDWGLHDEVPADWPVQLNEGRGPAGDPTLSFVRSVPGFASWYIVGEVGRAAFEAPLRRHAYGVGLIGGAWVLAVTALWGWVTRQRDTLNLERELVRREERQARIERSEVLNRTLVEHLPQQVFLKNLDSVYVACNARHARALGGTRDAVVGRRDSDFLPPDEAQRHRTLDEAVVAAGERVELEERSETPEGSRWAHVLALPYRDPDGRVIGVLGIYDDITRRKEMEQALRASEEKYRLLFDQMLDGFALQEVLPDETGAPLDYRFLEVNPAFVGITGHSPGQVVGRTLREVLPAIESEWTEQLNRVARSGEPVRFELESIALGRHVEVRAFRTRPWQVACTFSDITPRRRAEAALRSSLAEKEALLKEVHHRVKNNLQIVSSLLHLQSATIQDAAAVQAFRTTEDRVRSMALLHEALYRSDNLAQVDVDQYLAALCAHLGRCFGLDPSRTVLQHEVPEARLALDLELALPCGLIVNELVSNALKHAFPERRPGRIRVSLRREPPDDLVLEVADDGIGLPPGFDLARGSSLGLRLVRGLAIQLNGVVTLESPSGVVGRVRFPARPANPPHSAGSPARTR